MDTVNNDLDESKIFEIKEPRDKAKTEKLNIILFLTSKTISLLGSNIYNFALSLYILRATGSGASFTINILLGMLPRIFLGPFAGILADRVDRRKATILLDTFSGVTICGLMLISISLGLKVSYIYITSLVLSVINVFYDTMLNSSLPNLVADNKLMKINAYAQGSSSLSGILGTILAGVIYSFSPINLFLILNGISFFISALLELFMDFNFNRTIVAKNEQKKSFRYDLKEIIAFIKNQKIMYSLFKYSLVLNLFANAAFAITLPFVLNNVLKLSSSQFGIVEASFSIGLLLASIMLGSIKEQENKMKSICMGLASISMLIVLTGLPTLDLNVFSNRTFLFIYYIILMFFTGIILVIINAPIMVVMQRLTPDNLRGRFMGILGTLTNGIAPIGIIITGLIIDKVPSFSLMLVTGTVIFIMSIMMKKNKNLSSI